MQATAFKQRSIALSDYRAYVLGALFVAGNIVLPQLCHLVPNGGHIFLPIYFFTLVAAYKYGVKVGLMTALLSPLVNSLCFGMPAMAVLPVLLIKSGLLAIAAAYVAHKTSKLSLLSLLAVVVFYQLVGGLAEWALTGQLQAALTDFRLGYPGMIIQVLGGWMVLKALSTK